MSTRAGTKRGATSKGKRAAASPGENQGETKRQRVGVGSSVVDLVRTGADDFILLLTKVRSERLRPKGTGQVIAVNRTDDLQAAAEKMQENNILSLPVVTNDGKFYGFIEQREIVRYIMNDIFFRTSGEMTQETMQHVFRTINVFKNSIVSDVMTYPVRLRSTNHIVPAGSSLYSIWETAAKEGVHRFPVVDPAGKIVDIITQSMLIDFCWQNIEKLGDVAQREVKGLFPNMEVYTIKDTDKAYFAFREMIRHKVSGLAVVDKDGKLVENISVRDFKKTHVRADTLWRLWETVMQFLSDSDTEMSFTKPVYVQPTDTLYRVIEKMAVYHIHRVYVVKDDKSMQPVRVISQKDVLEAILDIEGEARVGRE